MLFINFEAASITKSHTDLRAAATASAMNIPAANALDAKGSQRILKKT
jgi:hypothetical protein